MKIKNVYRVWAYNSRLNLCVVEWYTSIKEVKLRAAKLLANGFDYIDDFAVQQNKPVEMSFRFHPDDNTDLTYYNKVKTCVDEVSDGIKVKVQCPPAFGCQAVKDICCTCSKLQADGHCYHEEIVSVDGCNYYERRLSC